ncbi:MAG: hypothetical protein ACYTF0_05715 [Planctomycetota bacterium]
MRTSSRSYFSLPALAILALGFTGCGSSQLRIDPLVSDPQPQYTVPDIEAIPLPTAPQAANKRLTIQLPQEPGTVDLNNIANRRGSEIASGASILLSVPQEDDAAHLPRRPHGDDASIEYKTDGYFHQAEQHIAKALINLGFNVVDRARFEAKLRDLRDAYRRTNTNNSHRGNEDLGAEFYEIKGYWEKKLEQKEISPEEYGARIAEARENARVESAGQNRDENEMNDISEVIRAARAGGDVKADYVLQINEFKIAPAADRVIRLSKFAQTDDFLKQLPDITRSDFYTKGDTRSFPMGIPQPWFIARFSAKLINVDTGSIDWMGEHEINSLSAEKDGITITIDVDQAPTNADKVLNNIRDYNTQLARAHQQATATKAALEQAEASIRRSHMIDAPQKTGISSLIGDSDADQEAIATFEDTLRSDHAAARHAYDTAIAQLTALLDKRSTINIGNWAYQYMVHPPQTDPNLDRDDLRKMGAAGEEILNRHYLQMTRNITRLLIDTIPVQ